MNVIARLMKMPAANYMLRKKMASKILVIDLDVHQGNGTAKIFRHDERVYTFSMHGRHNYPFHKEISDLDVPLNDGINDEDYLTLVRKHVFDLIEQVKPDFAFYLSGVDILSTDKFGKLKVTIEGCKERDNIVFSALQQFNIPCTIAMGGGYSADIKAIVEAHCNTFRLAASMYGTS
jgi:acetoin utilization deacetylase AcuC-like enzyme